MQTWTDTTYVVPDHVEPCVTAIDHRRVMLHVPGHQLDGRGFVLYLSTAHIHALADLLAMLMACEAMDAAPRADGDGLFYDSAAGEV